MSDTVISLTTIPSRVSHIKPCIDGLRDQGLPVYVWLQKMVERTGNKFTGEIPGFLQGGCVHTELVQERGPITKLLPALEMGVDQVITADDDVVYGEGWAQGLLDIPHSLSALGYRGRVFTGAKAYNKTRMITGVEAPRAVDILTGVWGAFYKQDFFEDSIFDEWKEWPHNDDLVINNHLKNRQVNRLIIPQKCEITTLDGVYEINSLWQDINQERNDEGLEKLGWWEG